MAKRQPKWVTPERQTHLVELFSRSQGFCVYGHKPCPYPEHHYEGFIEGLIAEWIADDRAERQAELRLEQRQLHNLNERRAPLRGRFSAIGKDIFYANQPQYYFLGFSISGLTFKAFVKVRLASTYVNLYVDVDLKGVSKNKRRKAIRYNKVTDEVRQGINKAIRHYLEH